MVVFNCPIQKKPTTLREIETITGVNTKTLEMWGIDPALAATRDNARVRASVLRSLKDPQGFLRDTRAMYAEPEQDPFAYADARAAFPSVDARSLVPAEIMGRIYYALLAEIEARRFRVFDERVTLRARRKAAIALRCWAGARVAR